MAYQLGILGAGNMAEAIVRAAIAHNIVPASGIIAADPSPDRRDVFSAMGIATTADNREVILAADTLLLAVKPQTLPTIAEALAAAPTRQVILSIMAGIRSDRIEAAVGRDARIVRIMPNTPLMAGRGMAAIALGAHAKAGDEALAMQLFGTADNRAIRVDEAAIDAVTAISGSGPAYLFYLAEAMEEAARGMGLGSDSRLLVQQTLLGAAKLLFEADDDPVTLRRKVTSPGGTTEAAIRHFDTMQVRSSLIGGMQAAESRSRELAGD